jgi:hypothetical protein
MRPLLFGYLNGWPSTSDDKLAAFTWQLTAFARTEGFTLHDVFAEQVGGQAAAFRVLVDAVQRHEAEAVAVPALDHLARVPGVPLARECLEDAGTRVLVVHPGSGPGAG